MQAIYLCLVCLSTSLSLSLSISYSLPEAVTLSFLVGWQKEFPFWGIIHIYARYSLSFPLPDHASCSACRVAYEISLSIHSTQGHLPNNSSNLIIRHIVMTMMMLVFAL